MIISDTRRGRIIDAQMPLPISVVMRADVLIHRSARSERAPDYLAQTRTAADALGVALPTDPVLLQLIDDVAEGAEKDALSVGEIYSYEVDGQEVDSSFAYARRRPLEVNSEGVSLTSTDDYLPAPYMCHRDWSCVSRRTAHDMLADRWARSGATSVMGVVLRSEGALRQTAGGSLLVLLPGQTVVVCDQEEICRDLLAVDVATLLGLGVAERVVAEAELEDAEGLLFISATAGVRPVATIDGAPTRWTEEATRRLSTLRSLAGRVAPGGEQ